MPPEGFKGMKNGNDPIAIQPLSLRLVNVVRRRNVWRKFEFGREL
jgi:hypothetical protein